MIQSVANYGWGVGASASDINAYWGNSGSSSTRRTWLSGISSNLVWHYRKLQSQSHTKIFCYNKNFQIGQELNEQHGKHSSPFFKDTQECCHRVHEFSNTSFDHIKVPLAGKACQSSPSPHGMAGYEVIHRNKNLGAYIQCHKELHSMAEPDKSGKRKFHYNCLM